VQVTDCIANPLLASKIKKIFGKCNNPNGHGHNYEILVSLKGEVDPTTGMVVNMTELKKYMQMGIVDILDHKNLDKDVPGLRGTVTTTENLAVFIWNSLVDLMPPPVSRLLHEVVIRETDKNSVSYRGEET